MEAETVAKLARFFDRMWRIFVDGAVIDGADLQDALERSELTEWRPASASEVELQGFAIEEGEPLLFLTDEGRAVTEAVRVAKEPSK